MNERIGCAIQIQINPMQYNEWNTSNNMHCLCIHVSCFSSQSMLFVCVSYWIYSMQILLPYQIFNLNKKKQLNKIQINGVSKGVMFNVQQQLMILFNFEFFFISLHSISTCSLFLSFSMCRPKHLTFKLKQAQSRMLFFSSLFVKLIKETR